MKRSALALALVVATGCSNSDEPTANAGDDAVELTATPTSSAPVETTLTPTTVAAAASTTSTLATPAPTVAPTTVAPTTTSTSTTSTAVPTTTIAVTVPDTTPIDVRPGMDAATVPLDAEIEIGRSVEGRPITLIRRGDPAGTRVLAVGVIHGNEPDGAAIIDQLAVAPVPDGVELWLVRSMNPDGAAIRDRQNANGVDLNRNFPENWGVLGEPGFWQYAGTGPASEPETQVMVALGEAVRPDVLLWYHQDLFRIAPGSGRAGEIRTRYAELTGLPTVEISGGTYTGTGSQWSRTVLPDEGVGITVELGPTLSQAEIEDHVIAVHTIATEFF